MRPSQHLFSVSKSYAASPGLTITDRESLDLELDTAELHHCLLRNLQLNKTSLPARSLPRLTLTRFDLDAVLDGPPDGHGGLTVEIYR